MALPQILKTLQQYRLDIAERMISHRLTEARLNAIKRNRDTWLAINTTANTIQIVSTDDNGTSVYVTQPISLPQNVFFVSTSPSNVTYTSLGRNKTSGSSVISLQQNGVNKTRVITVSATGSTSVSSY